MANYEAKRKPSKKGAASASPAEKRAASLAFGRLKTCVKQSQEELQILSDTLHKVKDIADSACSDERVGKLTDSAGGNDRYIYDLGYDTGRRQFRPSLSEIKNIIEKSATKILAA